MYTEHNFKSKRELKDAVAVGDVPVQRYTNGGPYAESAGTKCIEGPHYPQPHSWYATVTVIERDGELIIPKGSKVK
jgi:hypothetical protein